MLGTRSVRVVVSEKYLVLSSLKCLNKFLIHAESEYFNRITLCFVYVEEASSLPDARHEGRQGTKNYHEDDEAVKFAPFQTSKGLFLPELTH